MKILVISDFHGQIAILDTMIRTFQAIYFDLICFCGDVVKGKARGTAWLEAKAKGKMPDLATPEIAQEVEEDYKTYEIFFNALNKIGVPVMVVPGNMDAPESLFFTQLFEYELTLKNIRLGHENILYYGGLFFSGFGGEITSDQSEKNFVLQYPLQMAHFYLRKLCYLNGQKVIVLHTPPQSKVDLEKGKHKGCAGVNELIEWLSPDFVFCGHAHHARGEDWLGKSHIINPGPLKEGCYTLVDTHKHEVSFENIL